MVFRILLEGEDSHSFICPSPYSIVGVVYQEEGSFPVTWVAWWLLRLTTSTSSLLTVSFKHHQLFLTASLPATIPWIERIWLSHHGQFFCPISPDSIHLHAPLFRSLLGYVTPDIILSLSSSVFVQLRPSIGNSPGLVSAIELRTPRHVMLWFCKMRSHPVQNSSYARLPQQDPNDPSSPVDVPLPPDKMLSRRGLLRTYWLAAVLCCGGALFGYDSGVIGWFFPFAAVATVQLLID